MATTLFRGPILQGKINTASVSGYNIQPKESAYTVVISTDSGKTGVDAYRNYQGPAVGFSRRKK